MQEGKEVGGIYERLNIALMVIWGTFSLIVGFNLESIYYVISFSSPIWVCLGIRWVLGKPYLPSWAALFFITIQVVFLILITTNANRYDDTDTPALIIFLTIPLFYLFRFLNNCAYGFNSLKDDLNLFKAMSKKLLITSQKNKKNAFYLILIFIFAITGISNLNSLKKGMDEEQLRRLNYNIGNVTTIGESTLRHKIIEAVKIDPDRAAIALGYSNQYQIPLDITGHDYETLEGDNKWYKIDFDKINQYHPNVTDFLKEIEKNNFSDRWHKNANSIYDYIITKLSFFTTQENTGDGLEKSFNFIDNMADGGETALRQTFIEAVRADPDKAAKTLGYFNQHQIPLIPEELGAKISKQQDKWDRIDFSKIQYKNPLVAQYMQDKEKNNSAQIQKIEADNNYDYMVSKLFSGEYKEFGLTLITGILITWGIGLLPPLIIRFLILKRPVSKKSAIIISSIFCVLNIIFFVLLNERGESGPHSVQGLIALASYYILRKGSQNKVITEQKITKESALSSYAKMMNSLDPQEFLKIIDAEFVYESQMVLTPLKGKKEFSAYIYPKLKAIKNSGSLVFAEMGSYEWLGGLEPCVILAQGDKDNLAGLATATVQDGKFKRIDLVIIPQAANRAGIYPK